MEAMPDFKKRRGFTILEEAVVIAIIALIAIPVATFLYESVRVQRYGDEFVKGQYYANLIMQDFERRIRQATSDSVVITAGNPYKVSFSYKEPDQNGGNPVSITYNYELDDPNTNNSMFFRWKNGENKQVFPKGLEKGIINSFEITEAKIDVHNQDPPYYVTVEISTSSGTVLKKTIYLVNYYKQE